MAMDLGQIMKMLKDPQALQRQAQEAQERMASVSAVGSAGGGMVKLTINGAMDLIGVEISPEVVDPNDVGMLQDLIVAAHNDAAAKVKDAMQAELSRSMGGLGGMMGTPGGNP
ncbi:MAG: YbaB/EbfC family nucleoid-associated protein [Spirochaetales bacterium]|nr:YbaB/EbfC family nucleoid-associated protein [Spirochaetales bacterium]MBP7262759.1 YbaB/EbfC family nucleoid-associated protein [Spirochaetia bacterium]